MKKAFLLILMFGLFSFASACNTDSISGQELSVIKGCSACHSVDETPKLGPSWVGLYGSQVELGDASTVTADDAYLIESTKDPNAKIVKGYSKDSMPKIALTDDEVDALIGYIKSVK